MVFDALDTATGTPRVIKIFRRGVGTRVPPEVKRARQAYKDLTAAGIYDHHVATRVVLEGFVKSKTSSVRCYAQVQEKVSGEPLSVVIKRYEQGIRQHLVGANVLEMQEWPETTPIAMPTSDFAAIAHGQLSLVHFLATKKLAHGDLHKDNVLWDSQAKVLSVIDFDKLRPLRWEEDCDLETVQWNNKALLGVSVPLVVDKGFQSPEPMSGEGLFDDRVMKIKMKGLPREYVDLAEEVAKLSWTDYADLDSTGLGKSVGKATDALLKMIKNA